MSKYNQGEFQPKNPQKYVGTFPITYRSSWELTFMNTCDAHPNIIQWASESIKIPYKNPLTGMQSVYIPDFFVTYMDKNGSTHAELIEIKPISQSLMEQAKSRKDKLSVALNTAKWMAAEAWCRRFRIKFRVMTENQLYRQHK